MRRRQPLVLTTLLVIGATTLLPACAAWGTQETLPVQVPPGAADPPSEPDGADAPEPGGAEAPESGGAAAPEPAEPPAHYAETDPDHVAVLVNKAHGLPDDYVPDELVEPDVPFIFSEKHERRLLRPVAAGALERLFAAAREDDIYLAGVSGYRSQATQRALFDYYVRRDGAEKARTFSAEPRHSEHETGLAMDVSGSTGQCAAEDCFGGTPEAEWLARHAHEFGFIIRYPEGKESLTGYKYEPWHLRYVGAEVARELAGEGTTLEEYYGDAVPPA